MPKEETRAEMPFLDHLEELRWRILWSLLALLVGTLIGFWLVQRYDLLGLLKRPIAPFLPQGRLYMTHPTDAFVITIKLAVLVGLVLAAPVLVWQAWAFFSPALFKREKRFLVPVLLSSLVLFAAGAALAYEWVLPAAFKILLGFQRADIEPIITVDAYVGFAAQLVLAFGLAFQLPLVIMLLAALGVVTPAFLSKNRRYWIVIAALIAGIVTPTPDALTMLTMMVPLVLLYEVGIILARLVSRRKKEPDADAGAAGALLLVALLCGAAGTAGAQGTPIRPGLPTRPLVRDTSLGPRVPRPDSAPGPIDTTAARRMGIPTQPARAIPAPDSVIQELLKRPGFSSTRYAADSLTFHADSRQIDLTGRAMIEREGSTLEADSVHFQQSNCRIDAMGEPKLFSEGTVLVGEGMRYDTCERRGIVAEALTRVNQAGVGWFLRGHLTIDSASTRVYADRSTVTSSDLPLPDYHFGASRVKWVTNTLMVARPAVLYVRDVPVLWLPFIFQDLRRGRRSGILVPRFGLNDLVRTNPGYRRHISNIGYYVVLSDYLDAQAAMDWYAGTSIGFNGQVQYRWLNQFVTGSLAATRQYELGVSHSRSLRLLWSHSQAFDMRTRLNANVDFATSARVVQQNTVDPYLATATLRSNLNFNKTFNWGQVSVGGTRSQELSSGVVTQSFPSFTLAPAPINLSEAITWSPSFGLTTDRTSKQNGGTIPGPIVNGLATTDSIRFFTQNTAVSFGTPLRFGRWNVPNAVSFTHSVSDRRSAVILPDPTDTTRTVTRYYNEDFTTSIDWNPSLGLPTVFQRTWKLQPSVGIQNSTGGAFLLRNRYTDGQFVSQGKRLSFSASVSPALFGFFPGVGPLSRIRHSVSPSVRWAYAPSANVPEAYARALDPARRTPLLRSPRSHTLSFGLNQTFEGKLRPPPGDTTGQAEARKVKLLSLQTSGIDYDIEQAKLAGKNGWKTSVLSNQFTSDLLPGFTLSTTHDLWEGAVGADSARFRPFLGRISARFGVSANTVRGLIAVFTGGGAERPRDARDSAPALPGKGSSGPFHGALDRMSASNMGGGRRPFSMSVTFDVDRLRPSTVTPVATTTGNRTVGFAMSFSPTPGWSASWDTQYNMVTKEFGQHVLRLDRDLRRWHATFAFVKAPNGNFSFDFFVSLLDQPDIKFQYDQRTVKR
ncbi:MAG: twin-arginine translocase subunit TatC [Gemmatimonadetes bacterium]|nr:twin-arginine translocase subunit TatC [Gemmatimonadota bacterium]